jgi:hypothetical protein
MFRLTILLLLLTSCHRLPLSSGPSGAMTGSQFYNLADSMKWDHREPIAQQQILAGNIPPFLRKLTPVHTSITDSTGRKIKAVFYVTPDYLSIGNEKDWARVPLTPMTAQAIADSLQCFLPTRKMVNDIYTQATVKLEPVPLYAFRDSAITFRHHHRKERTDCRYKKRCCEQRQDHRPQCGYIRLASVERKAHSTVVWRPHQLVR